MKLLLLFSSLFFVGQVYSQNPSQPESERLLPSIPTRVQTYAVSFPPSSAMRSSQMASNTASPTKPLIVEPRTPLPPPSFTK